MFDKIFSTKKQPAKQEIVGATKSSFIAGMSALTLFLSPLNGSAQEKGNNESLEVSKEKNKAVYQEYTKKFPADSWVVLESKDGNATFGSSDSNMKYWLHFEAPVDTVVGTDGKTYLEGTVIHFNDDNKDGEVDEATIIKSQKSPEDVGPNGYYKTPIGENVNKLKIDTNPDMNIVQEKYTQLINVVVKNGEVKPIPRVDLKY